MMRLGTLIWLINVHDNRQCMSIPRTWEVDRNLEVLLESKWVPGPRREVGVGGGVGEKVCVEEATSQIITLLISECYMTTAVF